MFRVTYPLRFSHCDPAAIAFYPRYFDLCDAAIEDWTPAVLGLDRRTLHLDKGLALPTVRLEADFSAPSRLGDLLDFAVSTIRVGKSSVDLDVLVTCGEERRFGVRYTLVLTDYSVGRGLAWPSDMLERLKKEVQ